MVPGPKWNSPLVVTNPVTGWKALWGFSPISMRAKGKIHGVTDYEHELMKNYCMWERDHCHICSARYTNDSISLEAYYR